jgi:hypothetical protein
MKRAELAQKETALPDETAKHGLPGFSSAQIESLLDASQRWLRSLAKHRNRFKPNRSSGTSCSLRRLGVAGSETKQFPQLGSQRPKLKMGPGSLMDRKQARSTPGKLNLRPCSKSRRRSRWNRTTGRRTSTAGPGLASHRVHQLGVLRDARCDPIYKYKVVRPQGFTIPANAARVHGITKTPTPANPVSLREEPSRRPRSLPGGRVCEPGAQVAPRPTCGDLRRSRARGAAWCRQWGSTGESAPKSIWATWPKLGMRGRMSRSAATRCGRAANRRRAGEWFWRRNPPDPGSARTWWRMSRPVS